MDIMIYFTTFKPSLQIHNFIDINYFRHSFRYLQHILKIVKDFKIYSVNSHSINVYLLRYFVLFYLYYFLTHPYSHTCYLFCTLVISYSLSLFHTRTPVNIYSHIHAFLCKQHFLSIQSQVLLSFDS